MFVDTSCYVKAKASPAPKNVLVVTNFKTSSKCADSSIRTSFDSGEKVNYPHTREQEALDLIFQYFLEGEKNGIQSLAENSSNRSISNGLPLLHDKIDQVCKQSV